MSRQLNCLHGAPGGLWGHCHTAIPLLRLCLTGLFSVFFHSCIILALSRVTADKLRPSRFHCGPNGQTSRSLFVVRRPG
ncbi:hypothetical protein GQ607_014862 [Colletotrichum asianum]|uniref:Uncharacterized protein n=1 Tax=Colletotrichum asianum TaxID=702518 RepID=A0A8H3W1U4_9PEZI|nr:hypothetical protein GQ607_014862 [Colletotrichum asianum]